MVVFKSNQARKMLNFVVRISWELPQWISFKGLRNSLARNIELLIYYNL